MQESEESKYFPVNKVNSKQQRSHKKNSHFDHFTLKLFFHCWKDYNKVKYTNMSLGEKKNIMKTVSNTLQQT